MPSFLPRTDGVVTLRAPSVEDVAAFTAGRDEESRRWLGEGDDDPRPTAAIVVGSVVFGWVVVGWVDYDCERDWLRHGEANLGYNVFAPYRGRGYATRALQLLVEHLTDDTDIHTATLSIDPDNHASLAVAPRAAFEEV